MTKPSANPSELARETLIKLADAAMYEAKKRGSCFRFFGD